MKAMPIKIEGNEIECTNTAEHVGIVRSSSRNLPHILDRVSSHRKALFTILPSGLARHHNGNPAASIKVNTIIALPVLLSGVASLTLTQSEVELLNSHHRKTLMNLLKLPMKTPEPVILFLAGSLPAEGFLNLRQLNLFGMISRLSQNILNKMAKQALLTESDTSKSWFSMIRKLCRKYDLPSPLNWLLSPTSKEYFKKLTKQRVVEYWQKSLRIDSRTKSSLKYFKPEYMSLLHPHPIITSCESNPWETNKAVIQCRLLSGRYNTDWLRRHWTPDNKEGFCSLCPGKSIPGTIEHFLTSCFALDTKRNELFHYWNMQSADDYELRMLLTLKQKSNCFELTQFLVDPSVDPSVIRGVQDRKVNIDQVFKLTRTFVYGLHRKKLQIIGRFNIV